MSRLRRWWWVPLIGLAVLFVKAMIMGSMVRGAVQDAAVGALTGAGLGAVSYDGVSGFDGIGNDGLNVVLEGPASLEEAAIEAVEATDEVDNVRYVANGEAESAGDDIASDDNADAADNNADDAAADTASTEDPDSSETEPAAPAADLTPLPVLLAAAADGTITLSGEVPDAATQEALVAEAQTQFSDATVIDELTIAEDSEGAPIELTVIGEAASGDQQQAWLTGAGAIAAGAGAELTDETSVQSIEGQLNDLFALEPIEFDTNRSTIRPGSQPTLDEAVEIINGNAEIGSLRVVGHTDSDGSAEFNQALSSDRAEAVVQYLVETGGVDASKLEAEGRGETELLVDPDVTAEDKQRNRRIEWELLS